MSCFSGKMVEYPEFSIDRFDEKNVEAGAFFLSHCHADHMVGLDSEEFRAKIDSKTKPKKMDYTMEDEAELVLLHSRGLSQRKTCQEFHRRHPMKPMPQRGTLSKLMKKFRETGSVADKRRSGCPRSSTDPDHTLDVLANVAVIPNRATRKISQESGISHKSVACILKRKQYHPYRLHCVQELHGDDCDRREKFCDWITQQELVQPSIYYDIMFSDEAIFHLSGVVNRRNCHYRSEETHVRNDPWVIVWCGIHGTTLLGPYFFEATVTEEAYVAMLNEVLEPYLDEMPLATLQRFWFQQDGGLPHFALVTLQWLNAMIPGRWIGRHGPVDWPPISPDLTPLDFFLWGHLKSVVYANRPRTVEALKECIREECNKISMDTLHAVIETTKRRVYNCKSYHGLQFEHLLE